MHEKTLTVGPFRFDIDAEGRLLQAGQPAFPAAGDGWVFEPALQVVHADGNTSTDLRVTSTDTAGDLTTIDLADPEYAFHVRLQLRQTHTVGVIEVWSEIWHEEPGVVRLDGYASSSPNFGDGEFFLTQFHGDWADEAKMSTEKLTAGTKVLDSKLGVRSHQFRAPWFLLSKGPATEDEGEVFGGSLAWSGSFRFAFEILPQGQLRVTTGINPYLSAYYLEPGQHFTTPKMVWGHSLNGTGDLSRKLHRYVREEVLREGDKPRAILLNNWEATYFTFDEQKIISLFQGARDLGMEIFLLDDGWFGEKYPRDDDSSSLGDWCPDPKKLPNGLGALTQAAEANELRFGLWFEPEMVNPASELFEKHPDWLIRQPKREMEVQRHQMVLDLSNPEVEEFAFNVVDQTLRENPGISFVKWDCNRYWTQPGSPYLPADRQSHLQIDYNQALYAIMDRLAKAHPEVEVMMCSGGGGRVDYGAMRYAHELWPSDMTDPERRIFIQYGFSHFYPAIAMANHVTTGEDRSLEFAFDVAMSGRMGMDVDVDKLSTDDLDLARRKIADYKRIRDVVQLGDLYRLESPYDGPRSSLMITYGDRTVVFVYALGDARASTLDLPAIGKSIDVPTLRRFESKIYEL